MTTIEKKVAKPYMKYLLFIAGMGGLLYGIDVGVIAGALPYLEATTNYNPAELSIVVAAVLLGSVISSLFAGMLSDIFGRKWVMIVSGLCFVLSVPVICMGQGFSMLVAGRLLQGISGGLIGVVVPLYLAECLSADKRGSGTAMFQFLLTIGLVVAAAVGVYFAQHVDTVIATGIESDIFSAKEFAWKAIFWACAIPGVIFTVGALFVSDSPRWLFAKGKKEAALIALKRARSEEEALVELSEMETENPGQKAGEKIHYADSLFSKKYVVPFVIAIVILACNQATGINSVLAYIVNILNQAGLPGALANQGDLAVKILNCLMTVVAVLLVDRKGRKFLLMIGTSGIILALLGVGFLFFTAEKEMKDYTADFNQMYAPVTKIEKRKQDDGSEKDIEIKYGIKTIVTVDSIKQLIKPEGELAPMQVKLVYGYGEVKAIKNFIIKPASEKQTDSGLVFVPASTESIVVNGYDFFENNKESVLGKGFRAVMLNPFANPETIKGADFKLERCEVGPLPSEAHGWMVTICFAIFISAFAVGPGVCVWLALSELMPTRIRSNGMSIALLVNQFVSTSIAAAFLPIVGNYGYSVIFFFCAGCTVIYFITAAFFLPETKGKTLEEIEAYFEGKKKA